MKNEFLEKMTETTKSSYAAMQDLAEINSKILKDLAELQIGLTNYSIESGVEFMQTLSTKKGPADVLAAEAEYANEYGKKLMEVGSKTAKLLNESRDEIVSLFEKNAANVIPDIKPETKSKSKAKPTAKPVAKRKTKKVANS